VTVKLQMLQVKNSVIVKILLHEHLNSKLSERGTKRFYKRRLVLCIVIVPLVNVEKF